MRGLLTSLINIWQPLTVVVGAVVAIVGIAATTLCLTLWLVPALSVWPAISVLGVLSSFAAFRWGRLAILENA